MSRPRLPDNEVSKTALWARKYRAEKKLQQPNDSKKYTPSLSKEDLDELNIKIEPADNEFGWKVFQKGKLKKISKFLYNRTKYSPNNTECLKVSIYLPKIKQTRQFILARMLYATFIDTIPAGKVVHHIDNNPLNNRLDNLALKTREENRDKTGNNQYTYINKEALQ